MTGGGGRDDLLRRALERMAHQIRNPLQAVAMNVEVVRSRVRSEAPEAWEGIERFAGAAEVNVELLDRRLRLLLALGRRGDDEPGDVDIAALVRDFAAALRFDEDPPGVRVGGTSDLRARVCEGWLLALLLEAWSAAAAEGAVETEVTVSSTRGSGVRLSVELPPGAVDVEEGWERLAKRAGAALEVRHADAETRLLVDFPPLGG